MDCVGAEEDGVERALAWKGSGGGNPEAQGLLQRASQMLGVSDVGWHGGHRPGKGKCVKRHWKEGRIC